MGTNNGARADVSGRVDALQIDPDPSGQEPGTGQEIGMGARARSPSASCDIKPAFGPQGLRRTLSHLRARRDEVGRLGLAAAAGFGRSVIIVVT